MSRHPHSARGDKKRKARRDFIRRSNEMPQFAIGKMTNSERTAWARAGHWKDGMWVPTPYRESLFEAFAAAALRRIKHRRGRTIPGQEQLI